jgi:hypothetical protein
MTTKAMIVTASPIWPPPISVPDLLPPVMRVPHRR